jgi:hypothetical protein
MSALFQNSDIYVTMDLIEIKGQQFDPLHLKKVVVSKHGTELKTVIYGFLFLIGGLIALIAWGWTVIGWIAIAIGALYILINLPAVRSGKVTTQVTMGFQTTHTGEAKWESVLLNDYKEALKLQETLKGVAGLP